MSWLLFLFASLFTFSNQEEWLPPGTIKVGNYLVDNTEATNLNWLEYLYYMEQEYDSLTYQNFLPDSKNTWYDLKENRKMPITYLSYEQVNEYCEWRSKVVSEKFGKKVVYRLPTPDEWSEIAKILFEKDKNQFKRLHKKNQKLLERNNENLVFFNIEESKDTPQYFFSNVSEMTAIEGIAMGANNIDLFDPLESFTRLVKYKKSGMYLGFRCIAEVN